MASQEQELKLTEKLLAKERATPLRLWCLSFGDEDGPRGAVILEAHDVITAVQRAQELGVFHGGEVEAFMIFRILNTPVPPELRNQLLSHRQIEALFGLGGPPFPERSSTWDEFTLKGKIQ